MMGNNLSDQEQEILYRLEEDFRKGRGGPRTHVIGWMFLLLAGLLLMVGGVALGGILGITLGVGAFGLMYLGAFKTIKWWEAKSL